MSYGRVFVGLAAGVVSILILIVDCRQGWWCCRQGFGSKIVIVFKILDCLRDLRRSCYGPGCKYFG